MCERVGESEREGVFVCLLTCLAWSCGAATVPFPFICLVCPCVCPCDCVCVCVFGEKLNDTPRPSRPEGLACGERNTVCCWGCVVCVCVCVRSRI